MWRVQYFAAYVTVIYAKNTTVERITLWSALRGLSTNIQEPWIWILGGDFDAIFSFDDRLGSPITPTEI